MIHFKKLLFAAAFLFISSSNVFSQTPSSTIVTDHGQELYVPDVDLAFDLDITDPKVWEAVAQIRTQFYQEMYDYKVAGYQNRLGFFEAGNAAHKRESVLHDIARYMEVTKYYASNEKYLSDGFVDFNKLNELQLRELHALQGKLRMAFYILPKSMIPEDFTRETYRERFNYLSVGTDNKFSLEEVSNIELKQMLDQLRSSYESLDQVKIFNEKYFKTIEVLTFWKLTQQIVRAADRFALKGEQISMLMNALGRSSKGIFGFSGPSQLDDVRLRFKHLNVDVYAFVRAEVFQTLNQILTVAEIKGVEPFPVEEKDMSRVRFPRSHKGDGDMSGEEARRNMVEGFMRSLKR